MPLPKHVFTPPFNIVRSSHVVLGVRDLDKSLAFYEKTLGLCVEDRTGDAAYLRAVEERQHHSLVLRKSTTPSCERIGFKVASEEDLDKAVAFFSARGLKHAFVDAPFQGRTLVVTDPFGMPVEFYHTMEKRERLLQLYARYQGVHAQRLDHFNIFSPELQNAIDFYALLGFRMTEYTEEDGANGRIVAAWMHRKGNVHDLAFTNGTGPRLHHLAFWVPSPINIIHICDVMASTGYLENMERGPGRHGISNAFFLYVRDPDGHRTEFYASDYQTMDPDHEPLRWSVRDPRRQTLWGQPAPRTWFEEGSQFLGTPPRDALFKADVIIAA
ncbi:MAG TPA: 3,4-dihydroxyphenylacetate 2,3-dioxygenase [Xanthobacteraceae bacterium]|nr:3,4-dihydroxyphenylacetate 2,3-dioxygenase [Xanthobacteraceae bacterium]